MPFSPVVEKLSDDIEVAYFHDLMQLRGRTARVLSLVAAQLLAGVTLQVNDVSAGNGKVIEWHAVKSGQTLLEGADAFDAARLFLRLVGTRAALHSIRLAKQST